MGAMVEGIGYGMGRRSLGMGGYGYKFYYPCTSLQETACRYDMRAMRPENERLTAVSASVPLDDQSHHFGPDVDDQTVDPVHRFLELVGLRIFLGMLQTFRSERTEQQSQEQVQHLDINMKQVSAVAAEPARRHRAVVSE